MAGTGFTIRHKTARGSEGIDPFVTVALHSQPLTVPTAGLSKCIMCNAIHRVKTVHLQLDAEGYCLVSDGVLNQLGEAGAIQLVHPGAIAASDPSFDYINNLDDPPPIGIGLGGVQANVPIERQRIHVDLEVDKRK